MSSYREMLVWQKSMDLVDAVYRTVRRFPREELFVLSAQMRKAAISIPCNIAEGCGRWTAAEQRQFARHARGSVLELQTQIEIARRQDFIDDHRSKALDTAAAEVGRLLNGWIKKLRTKN
ncbi:MAG TPA: four helix bundle protein [Thermoanaerobaculia bacterium]|nr:four helix bundle protein [Thermoanaerobaculia bacterium]